MQLTKENHCGPIPSPVKLRDIDIITEEALIATIRRAITFYSTIQAHDGHWPAECAGSMLYVSPLVRSSFSFFEFENYYIILSVLY